MCSKQKANWKKWLWVDGTFQQLSEHAVDSDKIDHL